MTASHALVLTAHPLGGQAEALRAASAGRAKHEGRCLAVWATESGPLNRVVALWKRYDPGPDGAPASRAPAGGALDWLDGRPLTYPLRARRGVREHLLAAPLLELRMYATHAGRCEEFIGALLAALPYRERHSPCVGLWSTHERGRDIAVHLWAYDSCDQRLRARRDAAADSGWAAYRRRIPPLLQHTQALLLAPVPVPGSSAATAAGDASGLVERDPSQGGV